MSPVRPCAETHKEREESGVETKAEVDSPQFHLLVNWWLTRESLESFYRPPWGTGKGGESVAVVVCWLLYVPATR